MLQHIRRHYFFYIIIGLIFLSVTASFYRFMVSHDYLVRYEGECDPYSQTCYEYCEDEACSEPFYYSWITAHGNDIIANCEKDVTTCDFAYTCVESSECTVSYCDPAGDGCEDLAEQDRPHDI